jgi:anaerobic magnesium-protoporphyrin IX monomethyl ester cyclase
MIGYPGEKWADLQLSVAMLRKTLPEEFSTTIAYPLPGTPFYEQMRDRLMFEADWQLDWDYTAENKLLFRRDQYNTFFYRLVIRWFYKEWEDAWQEAGRSASPWRRGRTKVIRWLYRSIVSILAYVPMSSHIRFQPAEGR